MGAGILLCCLHVLDGMLDSQFTRTGSCDPQLKATSIASVFFWLTHDANRRVWLVSTLCAFGLLHRVW